MSVLSSMPARGEGLHDGRDRFVHRLQAFELFLAKRVGVLLVLRAST